MTENKNIVYRPGSDRGLLDLITPAGPGPFPVVVCIHGGGWQDGTKEIIRDYAPFLVNASIAALLPNYRLTVTHPHPAQEEDLFAVLDWIADNARAHRLDAQRIGLTGASAGAHLAALVGLKAARRAGARYAVRCILPVCGISDVSLWLKQKPQYRQDVEALLGGPAEERGAVARDCSPLFNVHAGAPPCLAVHGDADDVVPLSQSTLFTEALCKAGVAAEAIIVPGADHTAFMPGTKPREPLGGANAFEGFFKKYLLNA